MARFTESVEAGPRMSRQGLAPRLSSIRPEICAAGANPAKNTNRYSPALFASYPNETWEYTEAKKNVGTNAIMEKNSTALSTENARLAKIRTLISGTRVRSSTRTKTASSSSPPMMHAQVLTLSQPQPDACCNPYTDNAMPAATNP